MKKKILVTGGAGYIGSNVSDALVRAGFEVIIYDDLSTGFTQLINPQAKFIQGSVLNTKLVESILAQEKINGVIHLAAKLIVPESIQKPIEYYQNNTAGVISVIEACRNANIKNFVFSSTAVIYGNTSELLISETSPVAPVSPYGFSKLFSEQIIRDSENEFGLKSIILRYFNVAGASASLKYGQLSKNATHLVKIASETACGKRKSMNITGIDYPTPDGTGLRDYIHVIDLAQIHVLAIKYLLDDGESNLFNCGYGHGSSVREVIEMVRKVSGVNFHVIEAERRPGDVAQLIANSAKVKRILAWIPESDDLEMICKSAYLFEKSI